MKLWYFQGERTLVTEGYVVAETREEATKDAQALCDETELYEWDQDLSSVYVWEQDSGKKIPKNAYIWAGGESGRDITPEEARRLVSGDG